MVLYELPWMLSAFPTIETELSQKPQCREKEPAYDVLLAQEWKVHTNESINHILATVDWRLFKLNSFYYQQGMYTM